MGYRHETYDGEGNVIEVVDTRTLEEEKQRIIAELNRAVAKEMEEEVPFFEQVNVLEGRYDGKKSAKIRAKVQEIRGRYLAKRDEVMAMAKIEDVERVGW